MSDAPLRRPLRYRLAVATAWVVLAWETAWPQLWPPVAVALCFLILALFGLPSLLPWWAHWLVLAGFGIAVLALLARGWRRWSPPQAGQAARRVELVSGWPHRPLTTADDSQIAGTADAGSRHLWQTHRDDLSRPRRGLRVGWAHPGSAMRDRYGLRPMLIVTLFVALVISGSDRLDRVSAALSPGMGARAAPLPIALDLFLTPPDYTRLPPIYRTGEEGEAGMTAPAGSVLTARVTGARSTPELNVAGRTHAFQSLGANAYEIEITPGDGGPLSVASGGTVLGAWHVTLTPDAEPTILFAEPPAPTNRWASRIAWQGSDEYGITEVRLHLELAETAPTTLDRETEIIVLSDPLRPLVEADGVAFEDLTPHPWAGLPVTLWLEADDGAGQTGTSERVDFTLPERAFTHPIAQAIVDQRRRLMRDPTQAGFVAEVLQDLSIRPNRFDHDIVVFMAMRTAARRLQWASDPAASVGPVAALLWDTALRLEDGDLSLALDRLRQAQEALQEALDGDASDEEIARLMDDLRRAMDAYMEAMRRDLLERLENGELGELQTFDPQQMIDRSRLDEMMDRIEQLGQSGARDEASELLSQLQQMMENLQPGMQMAQPGQQSQGLEMLQDLQALTQAQQELLDRTFQQATRTPRGDPQNQQFSEQAGQVQDALRRQLGDAMRRLGEMTGNIPGEFGRAELSMRDAERALGEGAPRRATGPQTEALDQLQQGMQGFAEQLMEQMAQQGQGVQPGQLLPQRRAGEDPLGRRVDGDGGISTDGMELPPASAVDRARSILDELRRRAGERARPQDELDYIDRLLRRF